MALVRCPECGREGLSDKAEYCLSCGFPIRAYLEGQLEAPSPEDAPASPLGEQAHDLAEGRKIPAPAQQAVTEDIVAKLRHDRSRDILLLVLCILGAVLFLSVTVFLFIYLGTAGIWCAVFTALIVLAAVILIRRIKELNASLERAKDDADGVARAQAEGRERQAEDAQRARVQAVRARSLYRYRTEPLPGPPCPVCGSADTIRKDGPGLTQDGARYECRQCRHVW